MSASIPLWVPVVLIALVGLGLRYARPRTVRPVAVALMAVAMLVFSLYGVAAAFGGAALAVSAWALGYALAFVGGKRLAPVSGMTPVGDSVRVPGSWVPLGLFLAIFGIKFVLGFATAVHAPFVHALWFVGLMSMSLGFISGMFGARAAAVYRFAARNSGLRAAPVAAG